MLRKICSVGANKGVSIPKDILEKLNLKLGTQVEVEVDEKNNRIIIRPAVPEPSPKAIDRRFALQVDDFIKRYGPAIKSLARK